MLACNKQYYKMTRVVNYFVVSDKHFGDCFPEEELARETFKIQVSCRNFK